MIGLVLLYFIGNAFYKLADEFKKNKWVYAILGIVTYYGSAFVVLVVVGIIYSLASDLNLFDGPTLVWDLAGIPIGLASCWLLHRLLKSAWSKTTQTQTSDVLDADLMK